jgi:hypothetical protein
MPFALSRPRITAAFVAAVLACTAGLASAGSLPGVAQDIASAMLAKVGVSVSGPNEHAGTHPTVRGSSPDASSDAATRSDIAGLATTTELTGVDKGAAISSEASNGKSHAGQHGSSAGGAQVETPNGGGTGTADAASGGKSSTGTSQANTASEGHSSAGSDNASNGQETANTASGGHSDAGAGNGEAGQSPKP